MAKVSTEDRGAVKIQDLHPTFVSALCMHELLRKFDVPTELIFLAPLVHDLCIVARGTVDVYFDVGERPDLDDEEIKDAWGNACAAWSESSHDDEVKAVYTAWFDKWIKVSMLSMIARMLLAGGVEFDLSSIHFVMTGNAEA